MRSRLLRWFVVCAVIAVSAAALSAAVSIPTSSLYSQTFDSIGSTATATLPADFRVDRTTTATVADARKVGTFAAAGTVTTQAGGANLALNASNGVYNFGSGTSTIGGDRAIGFLSSGTGTASGNLYVQLTNNTAGALSSLQLSYDVEKYRGGSNAAGFRIQMFYSTDGSTWTNAGANFLTGFSADAANAGYATAPGVTVAVSQTLSTAIPSGSTFYLAWNYSVAAGATFTNAQALAIDNISIQGIADSTPQSTNPSGTLTANPASLSPGDSITVTVNAAPGANPASSGLIVTGNLTALGLGTPVFTQQGNNVFEFTGVVPSNVGAGSKSISATITDEQGRTGTTPSTSVTVVSNSTSPAATGSANPSAVDAGGSTLLTVTVTPGTNPASTGVAVVGDLSSIGGSAAQTFAEGPSNTFTFNATVAAGTAAGPKTLPMTVSDAQTRTGAANVSLNVTTPTSSNSEIVISQIYGGGGNSPASTYRNDFVELYNRGSQPVSVTNWTLQYSSATGSSWGNGFGKTSLVGTIAPGEYYLVALASGGANGALLPDANATGVTNLSGTTGKLALVNSGTTLTGNCPVGSGIVDFVGYGSAADCFEGSGTAVPTSVTNAQSVLRKQNGAADSDDNKNDFVVGAVTPRRTAAIVSQEIGPSVTGTDPSSGATKVPHDPTFEIDFSELVTVDPGWAAFSCLSGAHANYSVAASGKNLYITPNDPFASSETCTLTIHKDLVHDADTDDSAPGTDTLPADINFSFTIAGPENPPYTPDVHLTMGNPSGAIADVNQPGNYLMSKPEYALSYNRDNGRPNWVSWHLTTDWFGTLTRADTFRADPQVPSEWYRVEGFDFSGSGFDRGHMVPNADRDSQDAIVQATFLMSNMVAQAPDNNQGPWADMENDLRAIAAQGNELYIVAGPEGSGGTGSNGAATTIANGHVTVPAYTWKAALVLPVGFNDLSRVTCTTRVVAVRMPNRQGIKNDDWRNYRVSVDSIESATGLNLFSNLPVNIQRCIEGGVDGQDADADGVPDGGDNCPAVNNPDQADFNDDGVGDACTVKQDQTITLTAIPDHTYGDPDFTVSATASSGLGVNLSITGPATLNGDTIHIIGVGTVVVHATQPGNPLYNPAAPIDGSFEVGKAAQTISFAALSNRTFGDPPFTVGATGGDSGTPVTFTAVGACSASAATIAITSAGTCTVTAAQAGNDLYAAAADVSRAFIVDAAAPAFAAVTRPSIEAGTATVTISGTLRAGTLPAAGSVSVTLSAETIVVALGSAGAFSATLPSATLRPSGSPHAVTLSYAATSDFKAASGSTTVRVVDSVAPVITLVGPAEIMVEAGSAFTDPGATATDSFAGNLTSAIVATGAVNTSVLATYTRTYTVTDGYNSASITRTVKVVDTIGPAIGNVAATPFDLGSPNHRMIDVTVRYSEMDIGSAPVCSLSISSNEVVNGLGDGNTSTDWNIIDAHHVQLRAERSGTGAGRIYAVTIRCADASGNVSTHTATVSVTK